MTPSALTLLFTMGLAGGLHCAGMCGPLALLAAVGHGRLLSMALYLTGKTSSYVLLGALAGALGETLLRAAPLGLGSRLLALGAGLLLLVVALESLGILRKFPLGLAWLTAASGVLTRLAREGGATGKLLLGSANGLFPCPMTYGFLALAAASGSPIWGAATMLVLGLTSALPLALCALIGYRLTGLRKFPLLSGSVMLVVGALVLYRGLAVTPPCH
jgi:sulfite exporter TauE/SafE